jgi:hypothetical protein
VRAHAYTCSGVTQVSGYRVGRGLSDRSDPHLRRHSHGHARPLRISNLARWAVAPLWVIRNQRQDTRDPSIIAQSIGPCSRRIGRGPSSRGPIGKGGLCACIF